MNERAAVCNNPSCPVATSGICALGNDPVDSCQHYDAGSLDLGDDGDDDLDPPEVMTKLTSIRSSEVMREEDLVAFRQAHRTVTVALVGDIKAGKTTLLSAIYSALCKGDYPGHSFKGSRTLTGFARRHHLSLVESGNLTPATDRTSGNEGVGFYHLNVLDGEEKSGHLIISDRSGEAFRSARLDTSLIGDLRELRLADRVCFLLDGDKVTGLQTRAGYKREFKQLIWALIENDGVRSDVPLEVLTTKIDKLDGKDAARREADLSEFESSLVEEFRKAGWSLTVHRVCALPSANYQLGTIGIDKLLGRWLTPDADVDTTPLHPERPPRAFNRLLEFWQGT